MMRFILGALAGGLAAWWWRGEIQQYVERKLPDVREKTADRLASLEHRAEEALSRARVQIERVRSSGAHRPREMSPSPRNYTQGTGA